MRGTRNKQQCNSTPGNIRNTGRSLESLVLPFRFPDGFIEGVGRQHEAPEPAAPLKWCSVPSLVDSNGIVSRQLEDSKAAVPLVGHPLGT